VISGDTAGSSSTTLRSHRLGLRRLEANHLSGSTSAAVAYKEAR
jgi:hypothetical protein